MFIFSIIMCDFLFFFQQHSFITLSLIFRLHNALISVENSKYLLTASDFQSPRIFMIFSGTPHLKAQDAPPLLNECEEKLPFLYPAALATVCNFLLNWLYVNILFFNFKQWFVWTLFVTQSLQNCYGAQWRIGNRKERHF